MQSEPQRISRRALLRRGSIAIGVLVAAGAPSPTLGNGEISEADKIKQSEARYQTHPNGPQRCEICLQFLPPGNCKIVQAPIVPQRWCQFFAARENAR